MKFVFLIFLSIIMTIIAEESYSEFPVVHAPVGKIRGSIITPQSGKKIYSFRGIKYAELPRRFQVAQPIADSEKIFNATEEGPSCPQMENIRFQSEDCLRLNVYTTKLPSENATNDNRPVMVFIHPGSSYKYSGQSYIFGPQYLMEKDIVLVTINYRLSTLGLLNTGDAEAPGNFAFKDQVIALRWVQRNIVAFAGDPKTVTLFGAEFGAVSAVLHMLSPMSKGLFHRVIAMSGSPTDINPYPNDQKYLAEKLAASLNCPTNITNDIIDCLNTKPIEDLINTTLHEKTCDCAGSIVFENWRLLRRILWSPVVEPDIPSIERFLEDQPINLILQRKFHNVPLIAGVTRDELGGLIDPIIEHYPYDTLSIAQVLYDHWEMVAPFVFRYENSTPSSKQISKELRRFYLNDKAIDADNLTGLAHLFADTSTIFPVHRLVQLMAMHSNEPVYFYKFTYEGDHSVYNFGTNLTHGVSLMDVLHYFFNMTCQFPNTKISDSELPVMESVTTMWAHFAKNGKPYTEDKDSLFGKNNIWEKYSVDEDNYLDINLQPTMKNGFFPARMQEMEKIFPLSKQLSSSN